MKGDIFTVLLIVMGVILGVVIYLVLFVPPQEVLKYFGGGNNNQPVEFKISLMYYSSNSINAIIYNEGPGEINLNNMKVYAISSYGNRYNCNIISNGTINPNDQVNILINCSNEDQIINNLLSNNGYYTFYFDYNNYEQSYNLTSTISTKQS